MWAQTPIGALVFQLKSFLLMMTRLTGHVLRETNRGNLKPLMYFAALGPAFGMATNSVKDLVQMRGGEDEKSPELRKRNVLKFLGYDEKVHGNENDFLGWYFGRDDDNGWSWPFGRRYPLHRFPKSTTELMDRTG